MDIVIGETREKASLFIEDPRTGDDLAHRFISDTTGTDNWEKNEDGAFVITQTEYEWWQGILTKEQKALALMCKHTDLMTDDIYKEIWQVETMYLDHFSQVKLDIVDRVTTGKMQAKTVAVKTNGEMRISKDTTIIHCYEEDDKWFIDVEGTFVLNTDLNKYEIPIGTSAAHVVGSNCVTLDGALDCPINLSKSQAKVVYDVLFGAIKKELASVGCAGVTEYNLDDDDEEDKQDEP